MANRYRGEIEATLDGKKYCLVLTLGALAELESAFGDDDMLALASRFEKGRLSARDCTKIIAAGIRWGGCAVSEDDINAMQVDGGASGYVDIVARLLRATFGDDEADKPAGSRKEGEGTTRVPFPGRA